jgi:DNA-binding transcriptional MerR regulator
MNTDLQQSIDELKSLGFEDNEINQLLDLAAEEALDVALNEIDEKLNDQELKELSQQLEKPIQTKEDAEEKLNLIFNKVYGENAENKKLELVNKYMKETIEITKKSKDLFDRYQQGDPTAVATIQSNMGDPDVQAIKDHIE